MFFLSKAMKRLIRIGTLTIIDVSGGKHVFEGARTGPAVTIRLHRRALYWKLFFHPDLHMGEAYTDGTLTIENGKSLYDFFELIGLNLEDRRLKGQPLASDLVGIFCRRLHQINGTGQSRMNVAHHYDLSGDLYDLFLDADRQYSCAYFPNGDESLEDAQLKKKRHIAAKLLIEPGQRVLDIGSGWGGMALYLARETGADVTGITLSAEQLTKSQSRATDANLADRARFHLRDYRDQTGTFDRIVSVGMFEHVGLNHYGQYFGKIRDLLTEDGVAMVHTIGRSHGPGATSAWIRKYIFPGGYIPALSEIIPAIEDTRLWITDVEVMRVFYADTLRHWRRRFLANRDKVKALYDEKFCRMWEFYLVGSEIAFRHLGMCVFQIQLSRKQGAVPLTRDYISDWDRAHKNRIDARPDRRLA